MSEGPAQKTAMKPAQDAAISANEKVFPVFARRLASKDATEFSATARKLAIWLESEKSYYPAARPKIVDLLETALFAFTNTFAHHHASANFEGLLQQFVQAIVPFQDLFFEPELQSRLQRVIDEAERFISTVAKGTTHADVAHPGVVTDNTLFPMLTSPANIESIPLSDPQKLILQLQPLSAIVPGSTFPDDLSAQITRDGEFPVAAGGSADIYRGTLKVDQMEIKVAIKAIKAYSVENNGTKKTRRLKREMKVWTMLNHANVLSLFGTTSGFGPFLAMVCPWVENGTLTSYLEHCGTNLETQKILALIHDVASGLEYLHSQSVVHGDLSGSNVLIDANGRACIADFGLSTMLDEIGGTTFITSVTGRPRGTVRWAAPELLDPIDYEDDKTGPTTQSDVYSFGGIMLQILSGKVPYYYYSRDVQVIAALIREETPARPDHPRVTDRRWEFIQRCWSPVEAIAERPSSEDIVAFSNNDLVCNS